LLALLGAHDFLHVSRIRVKITNLFRFIDVEKKETRFTYVRTKENKRGIYENRRAFSIRF
jgi:hypothetical protein